MESTDAVLAMVYSTTTSSGDDKQTSGDQKLHHIVAKEDLVVGNADEEVHRVGENIIAVKDGDDRKGGGDVVIMQPKMPLSTSSTIISM